MFAIALFQLKKCFMKEDYEHWAGQYIRPKMLLIEAVIGFSDYRIVSPESFGYDFVEVIEITDRKSFENDNSVGIGLEIANEWLEWIDKFTILYCEDYGQT
jgi:hypothetical protein